MGGLPRIADGGATPPDLRAALPSDPSAGPPPGPTQGTIRAVRVVALGGTSMLLAGAAHVAGGGHLPSVGVLTVLALFVGLLAAALTRRRCRLPLLLLVLGVQQLGLHLLLDTGAGSACLPMNMAAGHGPPACSVETAVTTAGASGHIVSSPMLLAHVLATLLTAWLLACGEAALWRVADRVTRAAGTLTVRWPAPAPRLRVRADLPFVHSFDAWEATAPRGPPTRLRTAA